MSTSAGPRARPRARYVLDPDAYDRIYGPAQLDAIAQLVEIVGPPLSARELAEQTDALADVEVVLSGWGAPRMDEAFLARAPKLRLVLYGAGAVRHFATDELFARGVRLSSANAANAVPVAEYALATILFSLKHGWRFLRQRADPKDPARQEVPGAYGSRVGLLGMGTIGQLVRERLRPFALEVVASDPYCNLDDAADLEVGLVGLEELFATSAVVSIHAPLYGATRGIVTGALVDAMPHGATLVNTARGGLVRHDELAAVLSERPDLQAVLDVTDPEPLPEGHPLLGLANVVITPHIAGSLGTECRRLGDHVVAELRRYLNDGSLAHEIDPAKLAIAAQL